ncbi:MAG: hypothetical protein JWQ66_410 [Mucilaginibacter sp.]|nr:hypothetical protein [Mucilaginibacter sp.]
MQSGINLYNAFFSCVNQNRKYEKNYLKLVAQIIEIEVRSNLTGQDDYAKSRPVL